ncbi:MAG: DNA-processing protein DprA [Candidatus Roizmanbacteria bacterium]
MDANLPYIVALSHITGIGPMKYQMLLELFGSAEKAYIAPEIKLSNILGNKLAFQLTKWKQENDPIELVKEITKRGIQMVTFGSIGYPESLRHLRDSPICLYGKGDVSLLDDTRPIFSIVGTRTASSYGRHMAQTIASELSSHFIIASGLALGIDGLAHQSTLESKGKTIAVLGCGVDIIYPAEHKKLYSDIIASGGLIISEFPPSFTVLPGLFVARNRIISGLARGLLVVEGSLKSGSLITARYAADQGKDVFAVPSPATSFVGKGTNLLLKEGAILTTCAQDIFDYYGIGGRSQAQLPSYEDPLLQALFKQIYQRPQTANELAVSLNKPLPTILNGLSQLELDGATKKESDGTYYIT